MTVRAKKIEIYEGSVIDSYTFGSGNAGEVAVEAG